MSLIIKLLLGYVNVIEAVWIGGPRLLPARRFETAFWKAPNPGMPDMQVDGEMRAAHDEVRGVAGATPYRSIGGVLVKKNGEPIRPKSTSAPNANPTPLRA